MTEEELKAIEVLKNKKHWECLAISGKTCLDIVLNLIEKLQKENKYLRDENNIYRNETVSKYKIRDKLKELEEDLKNYKEEYTIWCYDLECLEDIRFKEARIYVLQELLEIDDIDFDIEED